MDPELQKYMKTLARLAILVLALVAIYLLFIYVFPIATKVITNLFVWLLPFVLAIIMAVIVEPIVNWFETRTKLNRSLSVILSLFLTVGGFIYLISVIISKIINELAGLYPQAMAQSDNIISIIIDAISNFKLFYLNLNVPPDVQKSLQGDLEKSIEFLRTIFDNSINYLVTILSMLPDLFIFLLIATVATFFIIKDRALIRRAVLQILPVNVQSKTRDVTGHLFKALVGFIKAYSILIAITAIITVIAMMILKVDYVLTIGITVGLLDILPILGPGTFFIPWIIWSFITGKTGFAISLLVVYIIISVVRQALEPKIVGDNIGLHPLATLISLYVGLQLGGFIGMIMGPVSIVIFMAMYRAGVFQGINWGKK
ncbi:MAG: sporulation integral membrane protein YtvI [Syntrophomonadaceae bacterium]|nr:sporulation integral membrane protein YtvI [Syntrophomonadaceae bacterium]MDD3888638.1 sporulation integral membrane protein YtvI [Syntrophomonadaceae bacterium]MDD4548261.1 sporulation integral membrane protein YtvI [Syntrophomonadaceae bacterium]